MKRNVIMTAVIALITAGLVLAYRGRLPFTQPAVPPIKGYLEGQEIRFIHTEVSDATVAQTLTTMAGPTVLVVASLAQAP